MRVIALDTNVLVRDFHLRSTAAQILLGSTELIDACLLVPEPVIDEACAIFRRQIGEVQTSFEKAKNRLEALTSLQFFETPPLEELVASYIGNLRSVVAKGNSLRQPPWEHMTHAPYPTNINHPEIFEAIQEGRAPFMRGDGGYKDFIIWRSILMWLTQTKDVSTFWMVTSNTKDFTLNGDLHPDLGRDLGLLGLSKNSVSWSPDLKALAEKHIKPLLSQLTEVAKRLTGDTRFVEYLLCNLEAAAKRDRQRMNDALSLPCYQDSDQIESLEEIRDVTVDRVYELLNTVVAEGSATATSVVSCSVPEDMLDSIGEEVLDMVSDDEMSDQVPPEWFLVTLRMEVNIKFSATLNDGLDTVSNLEVLDLSGGSFSHTI